MHKQLIGITLTSGVALGGAVALTVQQPSARAIASQTVTINFAAQVGDEAFACGETYSLGSADTPATAVDFRFYVSQVALLDADGNETPLVLQQDAQAFAIHLGSVGCQMDAAEAPVVCSIPNRSEVVFTSFDPAEDVVVADLAALLGGTNLSENEENTARAHKVKRMRAP